MNQSFYSMDRVRQWVGTKTQPATLNHYEFFGIPSSEFDENLIKQAIAKQREYIETFKSKIKTSSYKEIMNRIDSAEKTLLNSDLRMDYNARNQIVVEQAGLKTALKKCLLLFPIFLIMCAFIAREWHKTSVIKSIDNFESFDQQIVKLEDRKRKILPLIEKTEAQKQQLLEKLKSAGITNGNDLKGNPAAQRLANSLKQVTLDIRKLKIEIDKIDEAILHANTLKLRSEKENLGISDEELASLSASVNIEGDDLELDPVKLDALVNEELKETSSLQSKTLPSTKNDIASDDKSNDALLSHNTGSGTSNLKESTPSNLPLRYSENYNPVNATDSNSSNSNKLIPETLLSSINLDRDVINGNWSRVGDSLQCETGGTLVLPKSVPPRFELAFDVTRLSGRTALSIGVVSQGLDCLVLLDGWENSGLELIDGKRRQENGSLHKGRQFEVFKVCRVIITADGQSIRATVNGNDVINWVGDYNRLSKSGNQEFIGFAQDRICIYSSAGSIFRIQSITLRSLD